MQFQAVDFYLNVSPQWKRPDREAGAVQGSPEEAATWKLWEPQVRLFQIYIFWEYLIVSSGLRKTMQIGYYNPLQLKKGT